MAQNPVAFNIMPTDRMDEQNILKLLNGLSLRPNYRFL